MRGHLWPQAIAAALALLAAPSADAQTPELPSAPVQERFSATAIRADFADLYRHLQSAHFDLYARVARRDYDRLYRRSLAEIRGAETRLEVARRFQRFVAFGRVAHARIDHQYQAHRAHLAGGGKVFPLTLRVARGRAFVVANRSGLREIAVGDEIVSLNGENMMAVLRRCRRNLSADTLYMANALIELDLPMLLWLELGSPASFDLGIRRDGRLLRLAVPARSRAEMAAAASGQPPVLDLAASDRSARMLDVHTAYLRPGPFYNEDPAATDPYDNAAFRRFIDGAFTGFLGAGADRLIVDLRDNPGGDSAFSDLMISWFATRPYRFNAAFRIKASPEAIAANRRRLDAPGADPTGISRRYAELYAHARPGGIVAFDTPLSRPREGVRFTGRVFVLVNRNSFSNAVAVAATVQDYRFGTILGEETSDLATTYGAMETFTLPRTGQVVGFPKAQIVRPSGDMRARGVVPDLAIATPLREGPDDPVLVRALALASGR
jgi:hypothetical protein